MKKFIFSLFFVIFAIFNIFAINPEIAGLKENLKNYVLYPEMVERGFNIDELDNMEVGDELFYYIESFFMPNEEKGWLPLDNHHTLEIGKNVDVNYNKQVVFTDEYGTKKELLEKGYVENETMFYYPSNGDKDWRVGKWEWSFINYKGELKYYGPSKIQRLTFDGMTDHLGYSEYRLKETDKSVIIQINGVYKYLNDVPLPKKDNLILNLNECSGGQTGSALAFADRIKSVKYKKIIIITGSCGSAGEDLVLSLSQDKRTIVIGKNTDGMFSVGTNEGIYYKSENIVFRAGDCKYSGIPEGIGFIPNVWSINALDTMKNIWEISGDKDIEFNYVSKILKYGMDFSSSLYRFLRE